MIIQKKVVLLVVASILFSGMAFGQTHPAVGEATVFTPSPVVVSTVETHPAVGEPNIPVPPITSVVIPAPVPAPPVVATTSAVSAEEQALNKREEIIHLRAQRIELEKKISKLERVEKKAEPPIKRQARREQEAEEKKTANEVKDVTKILHHANITCSGGVTVAAWAIPHFTFQQHVIWRITNMEAVPIDIEDGYNGKTAVHNLCPGGAVTLFRELDFWKDSVMISSFYIARAKFHDGSIGKDTSDSVTLDGQTQYRNAQSKEWEVHLKRSYPLQR